MFEPATGVSVAVTSQKPGKPFAELREEEKIAELIFQLRDQNGRQWSQPGSCDVFMTAEGSRALDNEACIDPADTIKEYTKTSDGTLGETDNCSTHTALGGTPPKRSPNFLITKSVNQSVASPGEELEYSISVSNIATAAGVCLTNWRSKAAPAFNASSI